MIIAKVTRVANGKRRAAPARKKPRSTVRRSSSNPAHMLTLAFPNHKRRATMATKAKKAKRNSARKTSVIKRPHYLAKKAKSNHRKRSRNPSFFGAADLPR